ncbi:hypothetical protein B9G99_04920 [Kushneria konosiri]|uniref:Uncharacterized protein n=1 Tax=Kushneria konosiri TaxID=698828 RepID=A0A2Z2H4Q7_9GAMM|nr:hypothetical protein B9G99_04920 [Kushneria konosiri]
MRDEDVNYFSQFLGEFQGETDRGSALVGAALIDERLHRLLESHFIECKESNELIKGSNAPLGSFSTRIKMAYCLDLITELKYKECELIRRIRNEFAHQVHGLTFTDNKVYDLCNNLHANTPDGTRLDGNARQLYINSVILVSLALWYRPEYNKPDRARHREWSYQLSS